MIKPDALSRWTTDDSAELYGVRNWGSGYFDISPEGHVIVRPRLEESGPPVNLFRIIQDLETKGYSTPILLRFADILACQIRLLNESFAKVIREAGYTGAYRGVYPIKVNQKQGIIQDITEFGHDYHYGLEAGSKAELIAAIASTHDPEAFIICNGYKDQEFIDLALHALKMGLQTFIVVEMPSEVPLICERAKALGVTPRVGVRLKLSSRGGGHWESSGGDRSKFGLDASQVIDMVDGLRKADMLPCLQLVHYHIGSQIPDIRRVRSALQEACMFYINLVKEGAPMGILNIGGGLAVDYDGSQTNFASSRNYSTQEYAADVIEVVMKAANEAGVPHPMIVTESGRAAVANHSVLVFNVLDARQFEPQNLPDKLPGPSNEMLENLIEVRNSLSPRNVQEAYHDALYYRDEIRSMFRHGVVSLRQRALAENIFWHIVRRIADALQERKYIPDEMQKLETAIADVYYCNFSLFQSLPDSWAADQLFPIMPIHRLNEMPARQAVIADITCDSDGKIERFIDLHDIKRSLPLHEMNDQDYYLGVFLVGAYQETLGDMHNLLGEINVIHIQVDKHGKPIYVREAPGDSVEQVLTYVEYDPEALLQNIRRAAERAAKAGRITPEERTAIVNAFDVGMRGYTYFEK